MREAFQQYAIEIGGGGVGEENQGSEGGENNISWYDLSLCDEFDFFSMNNRQKIIWNVNQIVFGFFSTNDGGFLWFFAFWTSI